MKLDPTQAETTAHDAVRAARDYFGISPEWDVYVKEDALTDDAAAEITPQVDYMRAFITYDLRTMDTYEQIWTRLGHEIAHLVLIEHRLFLSALEDHMHGSIPDALVRVWIHADERAVSRLERMFTRDRPYPAPDGAPVHFSAA